MQAVTKPASVPGRSSGSASRGSIPASAAKTSSDGAEGDAEDSGDAKGEDELGHRGDVNDYEDAQVCVCVCASSREFSCFLMQTTILLMTLAAPSSRGWGF